MPRKSRKSISSKYIHVITKGIKKEYIFDKDNYKKYYINLLNKSEKEYNKLKILGYCIMDNHAHLLIYCEHIIDLSKLMSKVNTAYAIFYNKTLKREGYVFQNRYYTQEIMSEKHLLNTLAYIHKNPIKAKMVKSEKDYKYSSYNLYSHRKMNEESIELIFHEQDYLEKFYYIHKNFSEENIIDIEKNDNKENIEYIIKKFCEEYDTDLKEIKKNDYLLIKVVDLIQSKYSSTNKEIIEIIGIGKNRISNIKKRKEKNSN